MCCRSLDLQRSMLHKRVCTLSQHRPVRKLSLRLNSALYQATDARKMGRLSLFTGLISQATWFMDVSAQTSSKHACASMLMYLCCIYLTIIFYYIWLIRVGSVDSVFSSFCWHCDLLFWLFPVLAWLCFAVCGLCRYPIV